MSILRVDGIFAGYGETEILHGVSLHVEPGEAVTMFGPNGSGKSTLMKTIFGLLTPRQGSVVFENTDITGMQTDRLIRMGMSYVPQVGKHISFAYHRRKFGDGRICGRYGDARADCGNVPYVPGFAAQQTTARGQFVRWSATDARVRARNDAQAEPAAA